MKLLENMNFAGWVSIGSAIITIPLILISVYSGFSEELSGENNSLLTIVEMLVNIVYLLMFVVMFISFKYLLNKLLNISSIDFYIKAIIAVNILLTSISVISMPFQSIDDIVGLALVILLVPYGILHTIFGVKVMKLNDDLFGWRRSFSSFTIITGISIATVILLPIGLISSIVSDILMAIIFFNAKKHPIR